MGGMTEQDKEVCTRITDGEETVVIVMATEEQSRPRMLHAADATMASDAGSFGWERDKDLKKQNKNKS